MTAERASWMRRAIGTLCVAVMLSLGLHSAFSSTDLVRHALDIPHDQLDQPDDGDAPEPARHVHCECPHTPFPSAARLDFGTTIMAWRHETPLSAPLVSVALAGPERPPKPTILT